MWHLVDTDVGGVRGMRAVECSSGDEEVERLCAASWCDCSGCKNDRHQLLRALGLRGKARVCLAAEEDFRKNCIIIKKSTYLDVVTLATLDLAVACASVMASTYR